MRLLLWELREMMERMADQHNPELENMIGIYSRFIADLDKDEPSVRR
jgi:hypothetical protein